MRANTTATKDFRTSECHDQFFFESNSIRSSKCLGNIKLDSNLLKMKQQPEYVEVKKPPNNDSTVGFESRKGAPSLELITRLFERVADLGWSSILSMLASE